MLMTTSEQSFFSCLSEVPNGLLKTYLEKNWMPVVHTWANYITKDVITWGNKTNNFVERHNRVLKTLCNANTCLPEFFKSLLAYHKGEEEKFSRKVNF